jgi:hypothetical protein
MPQLDLHALFALLFTAATLLPAQNPASTPPKRISF